MRSTWKDILTITNTAGITGVVFFGYYHDHNAATIIGLATFIGIMIVYLFLQSFSRKRTKKN